MKAILLDGSSQNDTTGMNVRTTRTAELQTLGCEVEHVVLAEKLLSNCAGDFFCWIRNFL